MADTSGLPNLDGLVDKLVENLFEPAKLTRLQNAMRNAHAEGATVAAGAQFAAAKQMFEEEILWFLEPLIKILISATDIGEALLDPIARGAIESLLQPEVETRHGADNAGHRLITKLTGTSSVEPGIDNAARYLTLFINESVEAWLRGVAGEILTEFLPTTVVNWGGGIETLQKLQEVIEHALGGDRMVRRVLQPFITATTITPAQWHVNKTYRTALLSESLAVRQYLRGKLTREQLDEELARQGWSADRIEAHISNASKTLSLEDTLQLVRHGQFGRDVALATLRDQGYDATTAELALIAAETKRFDSYRDDPLADIARAFINHDLTESEFRTFLPAIISDDVEREIFESGAAIRRALNVKHMTHGEVLDCVDLEILSTADYRHWLEREGYAPDDATALELRQRVKMQKDRDVAAARQRLADERAAEKAARDAATAERKRQIEEDRRLNRRGAETDLERAAIRGLVPLARVEEIYRSKYDDDTVAILLDLLEGDRVAFVEQQQRADDARKRAGLRNLDVGDVERAVLNDIISVADYRGRLVSMGFDPGDVAILAATLEARKKDLDDAKAKRAQADTAARARSIDLGRAERLVRRGLWTFAQYDGLLASLGFEDGARAAMADLLRLDIADDAAARQAREDAAAASRVKGLSLEQFRRAVLLGVKTTDEFQTFLAGQGYTTDAQRVLLAELQRDVDDADAARRRREAAEAAGGVVALPLSRVARAARLSLISPATYEERLRRDGYDDDDVAIEMELLVVEIADVQAERARRAELEAAAESPRVVSLQQLERAVKAGTASINDYRLAALAIYAPEDVELLARTLQAEVDVLNDARRRRRTIEGELTERTLSLGQLETAVKSGAVTFEHYRDQLMSWGYGQDDAELLTSLLFDEVNKPPDGADGG